MEANKKAKELVMDFVKIIDPHFRRDAIKREVWAKAKKCVESTADEVLRSFDYHMDTRPRYRTDSQNEAIDLYKKVKQAIKNL